MPSKIVRCSACRKPFKIPDSIYVRHVQGRVATARCKYCDTSITIDGRADRPAEPVARVRATFDSLPCASPPESESGYWVVCLPERDAEMTLPDLRTGIEQTHISAETLLWRPGMSSWQRVDSISMLRACLPSHRS